MYTFVNKVSPQQYISILQILYVKGDYESVSKIIYDCLKNNQK